MFNFLDSYVDFYGCPSFDSRVDARTFRSRLFQPLDWFICRSGSRFYVVNRERFERFVYKEVNDNATRD